MEYTKEEIIKLLQDLDKELDYLGKTYPDDRVWERMFPHTIEETINFLQNLTK